MPYHVLFVDDTEGIRDLVRMLLELDDFRVDLASSVPEASRMLAARSYDLVLTDMRMEEANSGYRVVSAASQCDPRPVIVVLSAYVLPAAEWIQAGADAMLLKGISMMDLSSELRHLLHERQHRNLPRAG